MLPAPSGGDSHGGAVRGMAVSRHDVGAARPRGAVRERSPLVAAR